MVVMIAYWHRGRRGESVSKYRQGALTSFLSETRAAGPALHPRGVPPIDPCCGRFTAGLVVLRVHATLHLRMAIYHLHTSVGTRSGGQSASAKNEYINREGKYARGKAEVVHAESGNMPVWARAKPAVYWAAADAYERANGRLFREVEFALPVELSRKEQVQVAREFASQVCDGERFPYSLAIHSGEGGGAWKPDNPHCHLVFSERRNDGRARSAETWFKRYNARSPESGGARKSVTTRPMEWLKETRAQWADVANQALERAGRADVQIHEGSLEAQWRGEVEGAWPVERTPEMAALERPPGIHAGPAATALERREEELTERGDLQCEAEAVQRTMEQMEPARRAVERWIEVVQRLLEAGRELARQVRRRREAEGREQPAPPAPTRERHDRLDQENQDRKQERSPSRGITMDR